MNQSDDNQKTRVPETNVHGKTIRGRLRKFCIAILFFLLGIIIGVGGSILVGRSPLCYMTQTSTFEDGDLLGGGRYRWTVTTEWVGGEWRVKEMNVETLKRGRDFFGDLTGPPSQPFLYNIGLGFRNMRRWNDILSIGVLVGLSLGVCFLSIYLFRTHKKIPKVKDCVGRSVRPS